MNQKFDYPRVAGWYWFHTNDNLKTCQIMAVWFVDGGEGWVGEMNGVILPADVWKSEHRDAFWEGPLSPELS